MANWPMLGAMVLPNVGGMAGAFATRANIVNWYEKLNLPAWRPPTWAFGPVWTGLYTSTGYASYLVWRDGGGFEGRGKMALMLYGTQLALNWAWTPIFFGMHRLGTSVIGIGMLYATVAATAIAFYKINPSAGLIMLPCLAWLTMESVLTYWIWKENKDKVEDKVEE